MGINDLTKELERIGFSQLVDTLVNPYLKVQQNPRIISKAENQKNIIIHSYTKFIMHQIHDISSWSKLLYNKRFTT